MPAGLQGTLYRNGPNPQFPQAGAHWFGGDGMLHAFQLEGGCASYRNRWIRTAHWKAERAAGRRLFNGFGQPQDAEPAAVDVADEGTGNTNIVWHAGRLLALEEGHLPIGIEPGTLATQGPFDFGGALAGGRFTAHPKTDPATGELLFFGYGTSGPLSAGMTFGVADAAGNVTRFDRFEAPYASMVHDFAVTAGHVLFPVLPLTASMARAQRGLPPFAWEPQTGSRVGVLPRGSGIDDIRWFEGDAGFLFHIMNAWEERDANNGIRLFADVMRYDEPPLFPHPDGRPTDPKRSVARLCRWTFDLSSISNRFTQQPLDDLIGEFPRIDERHAGLPYRHGWYECRQRAEDGSLLRAGLVHRDNTSGPAVAVLAAAGRPRVRAGVRAAQRGRTRGRRLAVGHDLSRRRMPQRPRGVRCAGAARRSAGARPSVAPRAGGVSRQLAAGRSLIHRVPRSRPHRHAAEFFPFFVFALMASRTPVPAALFTAAAVSVVLMLSGRLQHQRSFKILEVGTALLFAGLGAWVLATRSDWTITEVRLAVDGGLLGVMLISIAIGRPFTLQYAREQVRPEVAALPQFRKVNYLITGVWALAFAVIAGADCAMARMPSMPLWVGVAITVAAILGAVWFTGWYPAHRQRLAQRAAA